jgi:ADP-ribosylglycohydrolase
LRADFDDIYNGIGIPYYQSYANEVVTKAICAFRMVAGNTFDAIVASVNLGRDTDCLAAVSAGIAGALSGAESIPDELIQQTDEATAANIYTNSNRTLRENADGLYDAFRSRLKRIEQYARTMADA